MDMANSTLAFAFICCPAVEEDEGGNGGEGLDAGANRLQWDSKTLPSSALVAQLQVLSHLVLGLCLPA